MDKDSIKGTARDLGGKAKEAAGKVTGNKRLEGEGKADQIAGKTQKGVGDVKDALRK